MEEDDLKIYSEEIRDVLAEPPRTIFRWGNTLLLGFILLLLLLSWLIKYPEVIPGQLTLTTQTPPAKLVPRNNGYIAQIFKQHGEAVKKGELIAAIQNPTKKQSLDRLLHLIEHAFIPVDPSHIDSLKSITALGELQSDVNNLVSDLIELQSLEHSHFFDQSIQNLNEKIAFNEQLAIITKEELGLLKTEIENAREKFEADSSLYANKVIAKHTFYSRQSEYFAKQQRMVDAKKTYVQHQITASELKAQKNDLLEGRSDALRTIHSRIEASKKSIWSYADNWQQRFVFEAPQDGELSYLKNIRTNDNVIAGEELFAIVPSTDNIIGEVKVVNQAFGKVTKGQKVRMDFANYPSQEFGQLIGEVVEVSNIPSEEGYFLTVALTNGLTTTYQKPIAYQPEMMGTATIITEDLRIIERVFNTFRNAFDN